jgi:hypothetical protein
LQPQREFFGVRLGERIARQQQRRFEIRQPRRHHEIVRRQFQLQRARGIDISEILLDQREDRNLPQIDLLPTREREQQIERPLPPVEIQRQLGVVHDAAIQHEGKQRIPGFRGSLAREASAMETAGTRMA